MKRLSIILLAILALVPVLRAADTGSDILSRTAEAVRTSPSLSVEFELKTGKDTALGSLLLSSDKFYLQSGKMKIWYDGTNQWTFNPSSDEVSLTIPTPDELIQVNPFAIINSFKRAYSVKLVKSDNNVAVLELAPKSDYAEIAKAVVAIDKGTRMPKSISLTGKNGQKADIKILSAKKGGTPAQAKFRYDPKSCPGAELIDLR